MSDLRRDDILRLLLLSIGTLITVLILFGYELTNALYIQPKWYNEILDRFKQDREETNMKKTH